MTPLTLPSRTCALVATRRHACRGPAAELSRMARYRGGTYSHSADRIVVTDCTSARTDLIRLDLNSLDFTEVAPTRPLRHRLDTWSPPPHLRERACEARVD